MKHRGRNLMIVAIHLVATSLMLSTCTALFPNPASAQKIVKNADGSTTTSETYPSGNTRLQETTTYGPDGKTITGTVRTEYDENGRPTSEIETVYKDREVQTSEKTWVYDEQGRLTFFSYENTTRSREAQPTLPGITQKYRKTTKYADDTDKKGKSQEEEYSSVDGKWHTIEEGDQVIFTNPEKLQEPVQKLLPRTKKPEKEIRRRFLHGQTPRWVPVPGRVMKLRPRPLPDFTR